MHESFGSKNLGNILICVFIGYVVYVFTKNTVKGTVSMGV